MKSCSGFGNMAWIDLMIFHLYRTLYSQLNHCVTGFGKRLLKSWLARPLYHAGLIRERQDAVASLRVCSSSYFRIL